MNEMIELFLILIQRLTLSNVWQQNIYKGSSCQLQSSYFFPPHRKPVAGRSRPSWLARAKRTRGAKPDLQGSVEHRRSHTPDQSPWRLRLKS